MILEKISGFILTIVSCRLQRTAVRFVNTPEECEIRLTNFRICCWTHDLLRQLRISPKLYGREKEVEILVSNFRLMCENDIAGGFECGSCS